MGKSARHGVEEADMAANSNSPTEPEDKSAKPLPFGQNLLGIEFLSDD
jgi:hypothetical protein